MKKAGNMLRRLGAALVTVLLLVTMLPVTAMAADKYTMTIEWFGLPEGFTGPIAIIGSRAINEGTAWEAEPGKDSTNQTYYTDGFYTEKGRRFILTGFTAQKTDDKTPITGEEFDYLFKSSDEAKGTYKYQMPEYNVTLIGTWEEIIACNVSYEFQGDETPSAWVLPESSTHDSGSMFTLPEAYSNVPADDGETYIWDGWYAGDTPLGKGGESVTVPYDVSTYTITGHWHKEMVYTVTYEWSGTYPSTVTLPAQEFVAPDETVDLPSYGNQTVTIGGLSATYQFDGWKIKGTEDVVEGEQTIGNNTTFVGTWSIDEDSSRPVSVTITLNGSASDAEKAQQLNKILINGQAPSPEVTGDTLTQSVYPGTTIRLPADLKNESQVPGESLVFGEWTRNTSESSTTKIAAGSDVIVDGDTVYESGSDYVMKLTGVLNSETYQVTAGSIATITRIGKVENNPKTGTVTLNVFLRGEDGTTSSVLSDQAFQFNYNGSTNTDNGGFGSVDLLVDVLDSSYTIYEVDYNVCYSSAGPVKTGWKSSGGASVSSSEHAVGPTAHFYMDNVMDSSTVNIYLTKAYSVEYRVVDQNGNPLSEAAQGKITNYGDITAPDTNVYLPTAPVAGAVKCSLYLDEEKGVYHRYDNEDTAVNTVKKYFGDENYVKANPNEEDYYNALTTVTIRENPVIAENSGYVLVSGWRTVNSTLASGSIDLTGVSDWRTYTSADKPYTIVLTAVVSDGSAAASLSGTKVMQGREIQAGETFEFQVTADEENPTDATFSNLGTGGKVLSTALSSAASSAAIEFGTVTFSQAGTYTYTITETTESANGVTSDPSVYTVTYVVELNGDKYEYEVTSTTIQKGEDTAEAIQFTNKYAPAPVSAVISVTKELEGREWNEDDSFRFTLAAAENNPEGAELPQSTQLEITGTTISHQDSFGAITFTKPGTYEFTVSENDDGEDCMLYAEPQNVTIVVEDNLNGNLTIVEEYSSSRDMNFTNTLVEPATGTISVTKVLEGREWNENDSFQFTLTAESNPGDGAKLSAASLTIGMNTDSNPNTEEVDHKASFGEITFTKPGTYTFKVNETAGSEPGMEYDAEVKTVEFVVTLGEDNRLSAAVKEGSSSDLTFTNTFAPYVTATIDITSVINGRDWLASDSFHYTLANITQTVAAYGARTISFDIPSSEDLTINNSTANHQDRIATIHFTQPGTYTFKVEETSRTVPLNQNETAERVVTFTVARSETDGTLTCTPSAAILIFNHSVVPASASVQVTKVLKGREWKADDSFQFTLTADKDNPEGAVLPQTTKLAITKSTGGYKASFGEITFTKTGTFKFIVSETAGKESGMTYAKAQTVTYTVTEEQGVLKVSADETEGKLSFTNTYRKSIFSFMENPKTGDSFPLVPLIIVALVSLAALLILLVIKLRRK